MMAASQAVKLLELLSACLPPLPFLLVALYSCESVQSIPKPSSLQKKCALAHAYNKNLPNLELQVLSRKQYPFRVLG
eukprot:m.107598 g.107598  ORF g.107598 m.107598 type:complete len:77 (+) comp15193_c0_seq1:4105-4335(+)